jgi:Dual specificity phosphatase, catalytic domain
MKSDGGLRMKNARNFTLLGMGALLAGVFNEFWPLKVALLCGGVAFLIVGAGYARLGARILMKRPDGTLPLVAYALYWPFYALSFLALFLARRSARHVAFSEVAPGLYLGCRLWPWDARRLEPLRLRAVLDLTGEFAEVPALRRVPAYLCLPVLDNMPPSLEQLKTGVAWLGEQLAQGPVYVHCALGHGRSAAFVVGHLLASGQAQTVQEGIDVVRAKRPLVGLNPGQWAALEAFRETLGEARTKGSHAPQ